MAKRCKNIEYDFKPLHIMDFHVNSGIAVIGFVYILCLTIHALYKYISISYGCCTCYGNNKQPNDNRRKSRKQKRMNGKSFCALISVLICSLMLFIIYTLEFWLFRACNFFKCNIDAFQFCNYFQHLLYGTVSIYTWILYVYFSVRLETSFGSSALAFPTDCFVVIRILATIAVVFGIAVAFVFTCGIPWDVNADIISAENPMLCRNVVLWEWYWEGIYLGGAVMLLSANFMNFIGYMNRLTKLLAMKLRFAISFKSIVEEDMDRKNMKKAMKRNHNTVDDMSILNTIDDLYDDEDYDDDVIEEDQYNDDHKYSDDSTNTGNVEINAIPLPVTPVINENNASEPNRNNNNNTFSMNMMVIHNNDNTVLSESTFSQNHQNKNKPITPSKSDIKNRMISRRKPDELRFYNLIRKQSVLTGVVSISSILFWGLQGFFDKGSIFILTDIIINVTCVYLSVSWTKHYYNKLCGQCAKTCCCCCEDCVESKVKRKLNIAAKQKQRELRVKQKLEEQEKEKHHE